MITNETIKQEVTALQDYLIEKRRYFHAHPEVSGTEFNTRKVIEAELDALGIPYDEVPDTSVVGVIDTGKPGPTVLLRTDIDALPVAEPENNLKSPRVCRSETEGLMHACGHDAHMAMALTAAKFLAAHKDEMIGKIVLAYEEGEEDGRGYRRLIDFVKEKYDVDACWGIHVYAGMPSGKLAVQPGPVMAGVKGVDLVFKGRGGHGSRPDQSINPVYCAANFYNNLAVAFANQIDANQTVTLGLTSIQGGTAGNIIPDEARVIGSLRFFSVSEGEKAWKILEEVAEHTAKMHHCEAVYPSNLVLGQGPTVNNDELALMAEEKLAEVLPEGMITRWEPWYASESFGSYLSTWPGVFMLLGIQNEEKGTGAAHHNSLFDVDEDVLINGALATVKYAISVQEKFGK